MDAMTNWFCGKVGEHVVYLYIRLSLWDLGMEIPHDFFWKTARISKHYSVWVSGIIKYT